MNNFLNSKNNKKKNLMYMNKKKKTLNKYKRKIRKNSNKNSSRIVIFSHKISNSWMNNLRKSLITKNKAKKLNNRMMINMIIGLLKVLTNLKGEEKVIVVQWPKISKRKKIIMILKMIIPTKLLSLKIKIKSRMNRKNNIKT